MDNQLVFDVLTHTIQAAGILGTDAEFVRELEEKLADLPPMQVGRLDNCRNGCRTGTGWTTITAIFLISTDFSRVIRSLLSAIRSYLCRAQFVGIPRGSIHRLVNGLKVNWWARLLDGNRAFQLIREQLSPAPKDTKSEKRRYVSKPF